MAEVEKSISISYKADLKDLVAKLKQMPNVTDQEAKKMVAALDRQLKQAEKAAQKSAEASKKAAKEASKAAARGSKDFLDMADSARKAENRLEKVGEASGDIDRGFSSIGLALRGVNPELADAADGLADAFAVTEGLTMSFTALNPIVLAGAAAVAAVTLGYMSYQEEIEKSKQLTLELRDAQKALNDMYRGQEANFRDSLDKLGEITDEYAVLTGQIDEYELALRNTERSVKATFQGNIDQQADLIAQREKELALVENMRKSNLGSIADAYVLSETEKETLKTLQLQTKGVNKRVDLTQHDMYLNNELSKIQAALVNEIAKQEQGMAILLQHQEEAVDMALQIQEYENESAKAKEKQVKTAEKKVELGKEEKDGLNDLIDAENKYFDRILANNQKLEGYQIEAFMSKEEREALAFGNRLAEIEALGKVTGQEALAQEIIKKMVHDQELERLEELKEKRKEGFEASMDQAMELGSTLAKLAEQRIKGQEVDVEADRKKMESLAKMSDIERQAHEKKKKQLLAIFRFEQGMALAEIAMSTAEGIMAAQKLIPPFNIVQSALVAATGVAQAGVVMSQQPPSFHMGGMAPDEMGARVLKGEAILDRATVRSLGGEQGVKQIQQNQGQGSQVMIVQPFKHFGRYTREIGFRPPKKTGIVGY